MVTHESEMRTTDLCIRLTRREGYCVMGEDEVLLIGLGRLLIFA